MDASEEAAGWHAAVSGKRIAHPGTRADESDCREDHAEQRKDDKTGAPRLALGRVNEDLQEGPPAGVDDVVNVVDAEEQTAEEDEARENADADAVEHGFGLLAPGFGDFLNHVGGCVEASQCKSPLKQPKHPGKAIRPSIPHY